jgi:hypothetical protein
MSWFDVLLVLLLVGVVLYEACQETGKCLMHAGVTVVALRLGGGLGTALGGLLGWSPAPGGGEQPLAFALGFSLLWLAGLVAAGLIHRQTRWSFEQLDVVFGLGCGLLVAVSLGHVIADVAVRASQTPAGLPAYLRDSMLAPELRTFQTYEHLVSIVERARANW